MARRRHVGEADASAATPPAPSASAESLPKRRPRTYNDRIAAAIGPEPKVRHSPFEALLDRLDSLAWIAAGVLVVRHRARHGTARRA